MSIFLLLYFTPTAFARSIPPTNPPKCAALLIPLSEKPISKFNIITGITWLLITPLKYTL